MDDVGPSPLFASLIVDCAAVSEALQEVGVDLSGSDAPQILLGGVDVLIALDLAQTLPAEAEFDRLLMKLRTFSTPADRRSPAVAAAQTKLLRACLDEGGPGASHAHRGPRIQALVGKINQQPLS